MNASVISRGTKTITPATINLQFSKYQQQEIIQRVTISNGLLNCLRCKFNCYLTSSTAKVTSDSTRFIAKVAHLNVLSVRNRNLRCCDPSFKRIGCSNMNLPWIGWWSTFTTVQINSSIRIKCPTN